MLSDELHYYMRYTLMEGKRLLGVRLTGERNHICERILRGFASGAITSRSALTSTVEVDGFGSQALSRLSIKAAARDLGIDYVHTPYVEMEHVEGDAAQWIARCETLLDLGQGCLPYTDATSPVIDCEDFVQRRDLWKIPHVIAVKNAYSYCNRNPDMYGAVVPKPPAPRGPQNRALNVAVHVRRGDVSSSVEPHRYTSDAAIRQSLESLLQVAERLQIPCNIEVFTNATEQELSAALQGIPCVIQNSMGALETFERLRQADVLFAAKSSFSYLAALYSQGVVLYDPYRGRPCADWVIKDDTGAFSQSTLLRRLEQSSLLASRGVAA